jgi:4-amino-4-deoxy-L-arabinose transferase-like glycosyltransferase
MNSKNTTFTLFIYLAILAIASLATRGLIPVDETRYTTVAWEMWFRGDFLVPYLNGETYSHKPPLLFWLIHLGWWLFGVNEWWPRLIPFAFSFAALLLVQHLGRKLWPDSDASIMAPYIVLGFTIWAFFSTTVMFDMMLSFFVLLAITGIYHAFTDKSFKWWLVIGVAWGLGMLSKGPVVFVHSLPVLLLAWYWVPDTVKISWKQWLPGLLVALFIASALILAWVIPATARGGDEYAQSLLFGQNVQRALKAPNDALPWWFYIAFMPFILFPWAYWGGSWKALFSTSKKSAIADKSRRFCIAWALPVLLLFTLISGKKVHYLLPVLPAVALYLASKLASREERSNIKNSREMWPLTLLYLLVAIAIGSMPWLFSETDTPYWINNVSRFAVLPLLLLAIGGQFLIPGTTANSVKYISLQTVLLVTLTHVILFPPASSGYDLKPIADEVKQLQQQGHVIAHKGKYRGEYHFLGRLEKPLQVINGYEELPWLIEHPSAYIVDYRYEACGEAQQPVVYQRLFRNSQCMTIRTSKQQQTFLEKQ